MNRQIMSIRNTNKFVNLLTDTLPTEQMEAAAALPWVFNGIDLN